jgi:hypothetical protein
MADCDGIYRQTRYDDTESYFAAEFAMYRYVHALVAGDPQAASMVIRMSFGC